MTMTVTVTRRDAEHVLARVRHRYRDHIETGTCPEPELREHYEFADGVAAPYAILWEEGPDEWAHRVAAGGNAESDRVLLADAAREFGLDPGKARVPVETPIRVPASVRVEPVYSFVLGVWPA